MRGVLVASVPNTEGWRQVGELALALVLSAVIGVEREIRQKSAGLRTHALVGTGAALFVLVSKYAFSDVLVPRLVVVDPSRVAAQIVTGIGFIGAGLIFVQRGSVKGLTTAAAVWLTAAVGAAAGGGLPLLALCGTVAYVVVVVTFTPLARRLPGAAAATTAIRVSFGEGRGVLQDVIRRVADHGFAVVELSTERAERRPGATEGGVLLQEVTLHVRGRGSAHDLAVGLTDVPGVMAVSSDLGANAD